MSSAPASTTATGPDDARWRRRFWLLLGAVFALRAVYLALFPLTLVGDEAYYWDWGRRLDWGYYSKPPLIAWIMALGDWLGGGTAFGLRIWAVILGSGSLLFTWLLTDSLYGARAAFVAALITVCLPATAVLNLLLTIDAPLVFCWSASLYLFWRLAHDEDGERRWWIAPALCLSLGMGHLAKQMMMLFPLMALATLDRHGWKRLPILLPPMLLSYLALIPPLYWNYTHDWITFTHTGHHFAPDGLAKFPQNFGELLGIQLGMLSPLFFVSIFGLSILSVFRLWKLAVRERFLVIFCGLPLLVMLLLTLRQHVLANWPAAFFVAGTVLSAGFFTGAAGSPLPLPERMRAWLKPGLWTGGAMVALVLTIPFLSMLEPVRVALVRVMGWQEVARQVQPIRENLPDPTAPIIVTGHRHNASQLAFYLPGQPFVYRWPSSPHTIESQYEVWNELPGLAGRDVLLLAELKGSVENLPPGLQASFDQLEFAGSVAVRVNDKRTRDFALYYGRFKGPAIDPSPAAAAPATTQ